jgi:photosystem II stability/assembly factor-like uncharacterized protein
MRSRVILITSVLVLALGACNPVQLPANLTGTPVDISNTPVPSEAVTDISLPTPPDLSGVSAPALLHIAFQDENNGWGVSSSRSGVILRSMDGGITWLNASPPGLTAIDTSIVLSVLDIVTAWVLVPSADFFNGTLYHTSDGGLSWTSVAVPFGEASLQFPDARNGRAMAGRGFTAGSEGVELFQTSDGGASWLSVFNNDPNRPDSSGSLPFSGIKNGLTFLDANTGWVTGTRPVGGEVYLYITHDGGFDWTLQNIPLPTGFEAYQYMPQAPVFFGSDGFLPLMVYLPETTSLLFYWTHNGGTTWTGDPLNTSSLIPPCHYSFSSALRGWCWDGGANLYITSDGAQTWSKTSSSLDLSDRIAQLEFVPGSSTQFTGWALTNVDDTGRSQLYQTTDNGSTWTLLTHNGE